MRALGDRQMVQLRKTEADQIVVGLARAGRAAIPYTGYPNARIGGRWGGACEAVSPGISSVRGAAPAGC